MKLKKSKRRNKIIIVIGLILSIVGISFLIFTAYNHQKIETIENDSIENFFIEQKNGNSEKTEDDNANHDSIIDYVAVIEIPKINLKRGLVDKTSKYNDVDINIYTIKESIFPNEQTNSHVILASHSGSGYRSYFRKLDNLEMKDKVYLYYENIKYIYEITDRYEVEKTGTVSLRQTTESDITLITCISGTNKQVVFVGKLIEKENY